MRLFYRNCLYSTCAGDAYISSLAQPAQICLASLTLIRLNCETQALPQILYKSSSWSAGLFFVWVLQLVERHTFCSRCGNQFVSLINLLFHLRYSLCSVCFLGVVGACVGPSSVYDHLWPDYVCNNDCDLRPTLCTSYLCSQRGQGQLCCSSFRGAARWLSVEYSSAE